MWMGDLKVRPGDMARCLFIHIQKYNVGGADDVYFHNKYTLELLSANGAAIEFLASILITLINRL